ncbi:hypothetical protein EDC96DRAFT_516092 [Choanephora cucurbitarum]|nr:hypothetical protein EDC96DRAFT_516092 [Choanephora cucurbitarum]
MFDVLDDCVHSLTSCNQTLDSLLSLLEPIRIETATYRELFDYSRDYDLATVRDIREVRKEVVKLLTVGNGKRLSDNVDASIAALKDQEIEMFNRVQQQELYMMNLRTADKIRKAALPSKAVSPLSTPGQSSMTEESHLLKQLDVRGQNLRKLCEAEEQLTLEEYNQVALLKKENLEIERELEEIHASLKTEEEQEREQQLLIQELKRLEQQIKDKQQLDNSQGKKKKKIVYGCHSNTKVSYVYRSGRHVFNSTICRSFGYNRYYCQVNSSESQ